MNLRKKIIEVYNLPNSTKEDLVKFLLKECELEDTKENREICISTFKEVFSL